MVLPVLANQQRLTYFSLQWILDVVWGDLPGEIDDRDRERERERESERVLKNSMLSA